MKSAVDAVKNKEMGSFKASRIFNVPQTTLERYVKLANSNETVKPIGRQPTLPPIIEADLVKYCTIMEDKFYGLTTKDVKSMAYQLALRNGIKNKFSQKSQQAGRKWLKNFFHRNPQISIRQPQGLSMARAKGFNPEDVSKFFDFYEPCLQKINNNPSRLYNCDETGITIVQHKHTKVVALKGKKQVASLQSAERGALVTIVTCTSPSGHYIPPLIIFPRKNMKLELMNGTPPGSIYACHPSGWIQSHIFTDWLRHFINHVKPTLDDPVVLVLDGHFTHTRNIDVINIARENHVIILCLPPHSSHKMQPLDVAFMKPFKTFYAQEIEMWLRGHMGRTVTIYQIGELFGKAYMKAANAQIAAKGFEKTGLYPLNRFVFGPQDYPLHCEQDARANETECAMDEHFVNNSGTSNATESSSAVHTQQTSITSSSAEVRQPTPSCNEEILNVTITNFIVNSGETVKASQISPIPILTSEMKKKHPRTRSAEIITSSPYKKIVEEEKEKTRLKTLKNGSKERKPNGEKRKENVIKNKNQNEKKSKEHVKKNRPISRKLFPESSSESDDDVPYDDDSADDCHLCSDEDNDAECLYCTGLFSEDHNGEDWVRCSTCFRWAHTMCRPTDVGSAVFVCDFCTKNKNLLKMKHNKN